MLDRYNMNHGVVGTASVPWQNFGKVYEPEKAIRIGTIFPELDKPFLGRKGVMR